MSRRIKISLTILAATAALALTAAAIGIGGYYYVAPSLPRAEELRSVKIQVPLQVYSRDGRLIWEFGEIKRTPVAYEDIPPLLIKAVLAAEDEHFFEHAGVDYRGVLRGIFNEISPGGRNVGGSTITQQITRTLNVLSRAGLSSGHQRFVQKFKEWILAFRIEGEFTKEEILDLYMNTSFFGQRSYGVVTAARTYFGKDLDELSIAEVALLAGIPNRPTDFNPVASVERASARRAYVLRRMNETGAITSAEYQTALNEPVLGKHYGTETQLDAPYVAEMVRAEMFRKFGPEAYTAGFKVTTTIDSRLQKAANSAMHKTLLQYDERHGYRGPLAHVDLPPDTGESAPKAAAELRGLLDDYPNVVDYETAIVLGVEQQSARVFFAGRGEQTIGFDAVSWAAPFINDDAVGTRPTSMPEVLKRGDIVRFRQDAGNWRLAQVPEVEGAFASVDPQDGAVVSLAGGFDFFLSNYNRATQARRQPGSSFKPFVYSAALQNGFTAATIVNDSPVAGEYQAELERVWRPENFGGKYYGFVSLRFALQHSLNSVSIRIAKAVGVPTVVRYVRKFGFDDTAIPNNESIALGAGGVAPLDLVTGYATFANGGYRVEHHFIERIADANGDVLYEADPAFVCADCGLATPATPTPTTDAAKCTKPPPPPASAKPEPPALISDVTELYAPLRVAPQVITPQNAYLMTDLLQDVARVGTGARAYQALKRDDLAAKTGTTNEGRDTWFVGFNSDVVAAAWVGFDQDRPLGGNEQGGVTAIPMWIDYMREALAHEPEHTLARPLGIVEYRINPTNGLIASDATRDTAFEKFDIDNVPQREPDPGFVPSDSAAPVNPAQTAGGAIFN
ncbi:MAG TPA: PBP1A family penicillin-binding protein [Gammaproteobacteria bacterium]|jgi:penicillin-binding protein 1A|nr:PBP1A family penicillin-binding protein [Gammaproteobacteria bacterium]